jgi:hypothetical protein
MMLFLLQSKNTGVKLFESMVMLDGVMDRLLRTQGYPYSIAAEDLRVPL